MYSDRLKKAIRYAVNQEDHLRRFLADGNIPCDNGHVERIIRSYSIGRANWLFADTINGAKVTAIMYSIVETARANNVNVLYYFAVLLMSGAVSGLAVGYLSYLLMKQYNKLFPEQ